jgi:hypothetical protein
LWQKNDAEQAFLIRWPLLFYVEKLFRAWRRPPDCRHVKLQGVGSSLGFLQGNGGSNLELPFHGRVNRAAVRRLFSFAVVRQMKFLFYLFF